MSEPVSSRPPLLVFSDDWGRHPSSCQHLVRQLLDRYQVLWVNTIGTRSPRLNLATLRRGLEKVRQWSRPRLPENAQPANLHVLNPRMWPGFGSSLARGLNKKLLRRQLVPAIQALPRSPIAITTLPIVADLVGVLPVAHWVYYCVDDFALWPGLDQPTLQRMEEGLIRQADVVIAVSETLRDKLARMGKSAQLLTHGVDLDFWQADDPAVRLPALDGLPRPLVVFWGLLDRRMDSRFVKHLAAELQDGTVLFVGPQADPDPELLSLPRVAHLPPVSYVQLQRLAREAAVLIMPYADLPVTHAMQPLKLKEYLATGKPAVVRDLPSVRAWADCLDAVDTPEEFARAVLRRLRDGLPDDQRQARRRLAAESWAAKAQSFEQWFLDAAPAREAVLQP